MSAPADRLGEAAQLLREQPHIAGGPHIAEPLAEWLEQTATEMALGYITIPHVAARALADAILTAAGADSLDPEGATP